jgi:small subunit ribosomal protein S16
MDTSKAAIGAVGKRPFLFKTELDTTTTNLYSLRSFDKYMAVKIRMKRVGAKNAPAFRIVVADGRSPRDGKFIEEIGTYQPLKPGDNFTLKLDRAQYWISKGAQPSDTVASLIKKAGKVVVPPPPA